MTEEWGSRLDELTRELDAQQAAIQSLRLLRKERRAAWLRKRAVSVLGMVAVGLAIVSASIGYGWGQELRCIPSTIDPGGCTLAVSTPAGSRGFTWFAVVSAALMLRRRRRGACSLAGGE
jgi:hypothetical protein